jgi:hypothetical protein
MRKVILHMNMALDGVVSDVDKWADINSALLDEFDRTLHPFGHGHFWRGDVSQDGRVLVEGVEVFEIGEGTKTGQGVRRKGKDRPDKQADDRGVENSEAWIAKDDRELKRKLTELKRTHGKAIAVERRATWHKFLKGGLFDELHIVVQPVIAGTGDKLCEGRLDKVKLQLAKEKKLKGGLLKLEYRKAGL